MELKDLIVDAYILKEMDSRHRVKLVRTPHQGGVRWAIRNSFGEVLGKDEWWIEEPSPSNRDEAFFQKYRWDTAEEALKYWESFVERWS